MFEKPVGKILKATLLENSRNGYRRLYLSVSTRIVFGKVPTVSILVDQKNNKLALSPHGQFVIGCDGCISDADLFNAYRQLTPGKFILEKIVSSEELKAPSLGEEDQERKWYVFAWKRRIGKFTDTEKVMSVEEPCEKSSTS